MIINLPSNNKDQLVTKLKKTYDFHSKIDQIGDIIEYDKKEYLILGIERVRIFKSLVVIQYFCQNINIKTDEKNLLNFMHYKNIPINNYTEMRANIDLRDIDNIIDKLNVLQWKNIIPIGSYFSHSNRYFRWVRYKSVNIKDKELIIRAYSEEVKLANQEEIRQKLLDHKREKMNLKIV